MLGLQGNASPSKNYQCVACSATFTGLASLLVHQASHAGSLVKPEGNPSNTLLASSSNNDTVTVPINPATSMHKCECGVEFNDYCSMMDHKQTHVSEFTNELTSDRDESNTQCDSTMAQSNKAPVPFVYEVPLLKGNAETGDQDKSTAAADGTQTDDCSPHLKETEKQQENAHESEDMLEETNVNKIYEPKPQNKTLMKILTSAYGEHLAAAKVEGNEKMFLKEEPELVVIAPQTTKGPSSNTDRATNQLKRLLQKPSAKSKAPSISRLLESSTKKIVSLTKIFSPVVLLETRHKFMDPTSNNIYGSFQCARCRRVFQEVDSLTEHHFLHKKERIKCCRCCKQLIIGRVPLPDNHVCPQSRAKGLPSSHSFKSIATNGQKIMHLNRKKVYFCPICKHNYARLYNLKMHKCRGPVLSHPLTKALNNAEEAHLRGNDETTNSVGVGARSIKVEETSDPEFEKEHSNLSWSSASSIKEQHKNATAFAASFLQDQNSSWSITSDRDDNKSEWTMPLGNNVNLLSSVNNDSNEREIGQSVSATSLKTGPIQYFVKDGVRRYPCNKCHQTFCSTCSLSRHKKLCCINSKTVAGEQISNSSSVTANNIKMYPCYVCGRNFNRKDNMMVHRKKCELRRTMIPNVVSEINPSLPPSNAPQDLSDEEDEGNWSSMSLPSVLPRRVTCECGIGFTSPKLLLEHLQKHAQESYTCPTCGVTVSSWAEYEIHLQLHMHPQHHKQPQSLLLQFKQSTIKQPSQQVVPDVPNVLEKPRFHPEKLPYRRKQQRTVCAKCGKSFASRCSLHRHISWNRCKGLRTTVSNKTYHCSLCNTDFPNAIGLLFHQKDGSCKPAVKPVRCPICLRWFTTTEGLQKHLLAHKNSETFRCDICQGTYPSLKSLKIHRRRIHRIMVRSSNPDTDELPLPGSFSI